MRHIKLQECTVITVIFSNLIRSQAQANVIYTLWQTWHIRVSSCAYEAPNIEQCYLPAAAHTPVSAVGQGTDIVCIPLHAWCICADHGTSKRTSGCCLVHNRRTAVYEPCLCISTQLKKILPAKLAQPAVYRAKTTT